jgi:hypothetical protein
VVWLLLEYKEFLLAEKYIRMSTSSGRKGSCERCGHMLNEHALLSLGLITSSVAPNHALTRFDGLAENRYVEH